MATLGRLLTAMVTPFDAEGKVNYDQARRLAIALIESGSDGVVISGTTGESPTLTTDEKINLFRTVKEAVGERGVVIAGTSTYSTRASVELTRAAENVGVDAMLLVVPSYNKPTQQGLFEHFKSIAAATRLPCILYNVPSRTITNLAPETVINLSRIENIVGIKEASGNLEQVAKIIDTPKKDFLVYSGNDSDTLPILALGGYGVISVISHFTGLQIKEMMNKFLSGQVAEAARLHRHLLPLVAAMFVVSNPIPTKYALTRLGFDVGKPRLPLTEPDEKSAAFINATLKDFKIDLPIGTRLSRV